MATINQIQTGLAKFIDEEIVPTMPGWQKWVIGAGATIALGNLPAIIDRWKDNELVKMLGVIGKDNSIDIQKVYAGVKKQAAKGPVSIEMPGGMGKLTLTEADVDKAYSCIVQTTPGGGM